MSSLISYEPYVNECADLFVQRLSEISQTGLPMDMGHWLQCYAFDVIGLITYGKRLGFLDSGKDIGGVMEALEAFLSYAAPVGIYSKLHPFLFSMKSYVAGSGGTGRAYVISFTRSRVAECMKTPTAVTAGKKTTSPKPFLIKFLEKHEQSPTNSHPPTSPWDALLIWLLALTQLALRCLPSCIICWKILYASPHCSKRSISTTSRAKCRRNRRSKRLSRCQTCKRSSRRH